MLCRPTVTVGYSRAGEHPSNSWSDSKSESGCCQYKCWACVRVSRETQSKSQKACCKRSPRIPMPGEPQTWIRTRHREMPRGPPSFCACNPVQPSIAAAKGQYEMARHSDEHPLKENTPPMNQPGGEKDLRGFPLAFRLAAHLSPSA